MISKKKIKLKGQMKMPVITKRKSKIIKVLFHAISRLQAEGRNYKRKEKLNREKNIDNFN